MSTLVCGWLVHWHWKASLISHLSVVLPFTPFTSLEELLFSSYYITVLEKSVYQIDFDEAKFGIYKQLWESKFLNKNKSFSKSTAESIKVALDYEYATYMDYKSARNIKEYEDFKLKIMDFSGTKASIGFPFSKKSPYLELFNAKLQQMFESGEIQKIILKHSKEDPDCETRKGMPLGFENITIIFMILIVGMVTSSFFITSELVFMQIQKGKDKEIHYFLSP